MVRRALAAASVVAAAAALLGGCVPELDDRTFLVSGPRLLAIASTPAEAAPPASVSFSALYVDPSGDRSADLSWAFCVERLALTDPGTVSPACIAKEGAALVPLGSGPTAAGALPMDACRNFGPDQPDPMMGEPAGRPVDPDPTGGYYQPVRLLVQDGATSYSVGATRIACGLAGATPEVSASFTQRYRDNVNPAIDTLSVVRADGSSTAIPADSGGPAAVTVQPGEQVTLHATWATCPTCDADCTTMLPACTGSEQYVAFDTSSQSLVAHREAIRVAWFATGGLLADDTSGEDESQAATPSVDNAWTAPSTAGDVLLWLVVRDDRGGVGWQRYRVGVGP